MYDKESHDELLLHPWADDSNAVIEEETEIQELDPLALELLINNLTTDSRVL